MGERRGGGGGGVGGGCIGEGGKGGLLSELEHVPGVIRWLVCYRKKAIVEALRQS